MDHDWLFRCGHMMIGLLVSRKLIVNIRMTPWRVPAQGGPTSGARNSAVGTSGAPTVAPYSAVGTSGAPTSGAHANGRWRGDEAPSGNGGGGVVNEEVPSGNGGGGVGNDKQSASAQLRAKGAEGVPEQMPAHSDRNSRSAEPCTAPDASHVDRHQTLLPEMSLRLRRETAFSRLKVGLGFRV